MNTEVYRGRPEFVHIEDGQRAAMGRMVARLLSDEIRAAAFRQGNKDAYDIPAVCPGCYMVAVFNCAIELARLNGQSLTELARSLGTAFQSLAQDGAYSESIESIEVQLDSEPCPANLER
jgi:hypothetical protein